MGEVANISWNLFFIILSGIVGYIVGAIKSFREEKQKAYSDIIPPILKMAYNPQDIIDEKEYSKALSKLWLYGTKKVTKKVEIALQIMHNPSMGDLTKALQEAVVEMRKDIQLLSLQNLKPEQVNHLYSKIANRRINSDKLEAIRQIKSVTDNIPPDLDSRALEDRLNSDPEFLKSLAMRLQRLFGLRTELIPFMDQEMVDFIDRKLTPLYKIENGRCTFRTDKIKEFASLAYEAKSLVTFAENKLTKEYRELER
jgi:hypothetical protein